MSRAGSHPSTGKRRGEAMLHIGDYNTLEVLRITRGNCILGAGEHEIPLPLREAPKQTRPGDKLKVFVYNESKERLGATTHTPLAKVGEFAVLPVNDVTDFGAFLEWGLSKDLFLPRKYFPRSGEGEHGATRSRERSVEVGERVPVYLIPDYHKRGVIATARIEEHFDRDTSMLEANRQVELLVFELTNLGARVVIDNRWEGLLYRNEIFERIAPGDRKSGYIKKVREDGLIDAALQPQGFPAANRKARETILRTLEKHGGYLPLHDKSDPEEIRRMLQMSKKLFKNTIGNLYKTGEIVIEERGIRRR
jgi:hypothetical protein